MEKRPRNDRSWDWYARRGLYDSKTSRSQYHRLHSALLDTGEGVGCRPQRLLDVGCGTGELLLEVRRRYQKARLSGIDYSVEMLALSRRKFEPGQVDLRHGSAERLPFDDASFDVVTSTASMHHWPDDLAGMREVRRVLTPDGFFLLSVPVVRGLWDRRAWSLIVSKRFDLVRHVYTEDGLQERLARSGLHLSVGSTVNWTGLRMTLWALSPTP